jgi:hypothetical protein
MNFIGQHACRRSRGFNQMQMLPLREGTVHLHIPELPACDIIAMQNLPPRPRRTYFRAQRHPGSIANTTVVRCHLNAFPRRIEPGKRSGSLMPREDLRRRALDPHRALENFVGHRGQLEVGREFSPRHATQPAG